MRAFSRSSRSGSAVDTPPTTGATSADTVDAHAVVRSVGQQAAELGREAAEVRGLIDDAQQVAAHQAEAVMALAERLQEVSRAQDAIGVQTGGSRDAVARARSAVEDVGQEVSAIVDTLRQVSNAAAQISQIAVQTRLVAFNASVEAKRAGESGRGFGVVADAVKDLAGKVERSSKHIMQTIGDLDARVEALAREIRRPADGPGDRGPASAPPSAFQRALLEVEGSVGRIDSVAASSHDICAGVNGQMKVIETEISQTGRKLDAVVARSESFLRISEHLIEAVAACGIETPDTPFILGAQRAAGEISALLEEALRCGAISVDALFDSQYRPINGTQPPQHTSRFVELTDRLFPTVQERMLSLSDKVVYCIAADRNGYVATHNRKYCHPQRGDRVWDTANSRYRRIFGDRTGLASARNTRPFLLQTYRRDMGGGQFVVMKEVAAPITVRGRHWGGLRLAFNF